MAVMDLWVMEPTRVQQLARTGVHFCTTNLAKVGSLRTKIGELAHFLFLAMTSLKPWDSHSLNTLS